MFTTLIANSRHVRNSCTRLHRCRYCTPEVLQLSYSYTAAQRRSACLSAHAVTRLTYPLHCRSDHTCILCVIFPHCPIPATLAPNPAAVSPSAQHCSISFIREGLQGTPEHLFVGRIDKLWSPNVVGTTSATMAQHDSDADLLGGDSCRGSCDINRRCPQHIREPTSLQPIPLPFESP